MSEREREVLAAARDGGTAAESAARLYLSEGTVRNHLSAAIRKAGGAQPAGESAHRRGQDWL